MREERERGEKKEREEIRKRERGEKKERKIDEKNVREESRKREGGYRQRHGEGWWVGRNQTAGKNLEVFRKICDIQMTVRSCGGSLMAITREDD